MGLYFGPPRKTDFEREFNGWSVNQLFTWRFDGDEIECRVDENDLQKQMCLIKRLDTQYPIGWYSWDDLNALIGKDITFN